MKNEEFEMKNNPENQGLYKREFEHDSCGVGFVAHIKGDKSHNIVRRGIEILERMEHRGAEGADNKTGDGSGIMIQIPHEFYSSEVSGLGNPGEYSAGLVFLPTDKEAADSCIKIFEKSAAEEGLKVIAWRDVPVDNTEIGTIAKKSEPGIKQVFLTSSKKIKQNELELKSFILRKSTAKLILESNIQGSSDFYIPSLSTKTIVYKGMLTPGQVKLFYPELQNKKLTSAIALVHSRFSTNTFPSWDLAQPFRIVAHNGEINTVKGNRFWMKAREPYLSSPVFGENLSKILPIIEPGKSDSASFDNALEFIVAAGRSLPHALMMMIPESWNDKNPIPEDLKYFYEYHSTFMEPWDGPASMVFCDGRFIGGTLDRNGLRPSRFIITKDDIIVMASEVGVQDFPAAQIAQKGRLLPGKLLLVDTQEGRIIPDEEIKKCTANSKPYKEWVENNRVVISDIKSRGTSYEDLSNEKVHELQLLHGYNREDINTHIHTMATTGQEPVGSMGTDTPIAVFSDKPQPLFNYFKQNFAQVTNPAIDPIREDLVMTLTSYIGPERNLLSETPEHCRMIKYFSPIFTDNELSIFRNSTNPDIKSGVIDILFKVDGGEDALEKAMDRICAEAETMASKGINYIILSDRNTDAEHAPVPSLLAVAGVHHHLIRTGKRKSASLLLESGEPREIMHYALLFSYGAGAVNPYGVFASIKTMQNQGLIADEKEYSSLEENYIRSVNKGLMKIMSKMGTSTLRSYRGSQIVEAIGLSEKLVNLYFTGTESRIGGIDMKDIAKETLERHRKAYFQRPPLLESDGVYAYRKGGEKHAWSPEAIHMLQWAARTNDYQKYKQFSELVNRHNRKPNVIRGLLDFKQGTPIPIDEVEPEEEILKRLTTGAMSYGSISKDAHEAIAVAMNAIGGRSNSGEGGEDPIRFIRREDGTLARSAIKQVASGRFGVTSNYLTNADEIQIKIAQGAKPGEGGQLPGHKVDKIIAKTRFSTQGVTLISPPPHHDIYSIEDLAQLIFDLKNANPNARISVKLVSETGVGTVAAGVAKAHADNILISGYDGGTGASPISSIKHAGLPWELGLSETHQTLVLNDLRGRVRLQTDGQIKNGRDIVIAGMLGAEEFGFGTATLIVMGCIMMRKCHLNTCPVGVATQDPLLRSRFKGRPEHLINYFKFIVREVREIMASLGIRKFNDLIGRSDLLVQSGSGHWKADTVDLSKILYRPAEADKHSVYCVQKQIHKLDGVLDKKIISKVKPAIEEKKDFNVYIEMPISNTDRAVGAMVSNLVSRHFGENGLPDNTIQCVFRGSAGQSFGAFLARGITMRLEGDSNDYLGKGLSGGRIIVVPPSGSAFKAEDNIIIGNTVLYGATGGEAYIRGIAGERFCVRNSGALAVVEGSGDHCAEYMTGGRIVVLGKVGRNFAAGMSGGIAYVLDENSDFEYFCNRGMVELSPVQDFEDQDFLVEMLKKHIEHTNSTKAKNIVNKWYEYLPKFVKVIPVEYKRALNELKMEQIDRKLHEIRQEEDLEDIY